MTRYTFDGIPYPLRWSLTCSVCGREFGEGTEDEAYAPALCLFCEEDDGYRLTERGALYQTLPEDHPAVGMREED